MKTPFNISYRNAIESGKYSVETADGSPVRIICWNRKGSHPIIALIGANEEFLLSYPVTGKLGKYDSSILNLVLVKNE